MAEHVEIVEATKLLQEKIGSGPLDEATIAECQRIIDENNVDFVPLGMQLLDNLQKVLEDVKKDTAKTIDEKRQALVEPLMELKANATIFHYGLIGELATVMLTFAESLQDIDDDAMDIITVYHKTLSVIISKKMNGDGGDDGAKMVSEMKAACARYYDKKKSKNSF